MRRAAQASALMLLGASRAASSGHSEHHKYSPPAKYPAIDDFCSHAAARVAKNNLSANPYWRPQCLDPGTYYNDTYGAIHTTATGFYAYEGPHAGQWRQDTLNFDKHDTSHGWRWHLPPPCDFVPFAGHFFCETMHAAHAKQRLHRDHDATREAQRGGPRDRPREALSGTGTAPAAQLTPAELVALAAEPKKKHGHHGHHETDSADNTADGGKDERPYLVFVGDSIVAGQLQALWLSPEQLVNVGGPRGHGPNGGSHVCGVEIRSYRSDRLHEHQKDGTPVGWVEAVCGATVAVVNYGAHANGVNDFEKNVKAAAAALEAKCGDAIRGPGRPKVFFRTTPEGNPWCNSKEPEHQNMADMAHWSEHTWRVLSGERPPPDPDLYKLQWHWHEFPKMNEVAAAVLAPLGIAMLDVVAMSRLRSSSDWGKRDGSKLDCLHGNAAVHEWNTLLVNALAADLCPPAPTA